MPKNKQKRKIYIGIIMFLATVGLFVSFAFSFEKKTTSENLALYFKVWGDIRFIMTNSNPDCEKIDSIALEDISVIIKNPSRREFNKIITKLQDSNFDNCCGDFSDLSTCQIEQHKVTKSLIFKDNRYPVLNLKVEDKLLAVCRYWNVIRFFYPHYNTISTIWFVKLPDFIEKIITTSSIQDYHMHICEMAAITGDGHADVISSVLQNYWGYYRIPLGVSIVNKELIISNIYLPLEENDVIKLGDRIKSINNVSFEDFLTKNKHLIAASNTQTLMDKGAMLFLKAKSGKSIEIRILRSDTIIVSEIDPIYTTQIDEDHSKSLFPAISKSQFFDSVAYLNIGKISSRGLQEIIDSIFQYPSIILDFREYPKISRDVLAEYFFDKPRIVVGWKYPNLNNPGEFVAGPPITLGSNNDSSYKGQIALLVNSNTWSQGEFTALAFQSLPNCITIGRATSGTDGDVSTLSLAGGIKVKFTGLDITYPDGTPTYKVGLQIDYLYHPKIEDWEMGKDPELQFAIKVLKNLGT